jgi:hypothetical protein
MGRRGKFASRRHVPDAYRVICGATIRTDMVIFWRIAIFDLDC